MAENFSPNTEKMKEHLNYLFGGIPSAYDDGLIEISILNASKYFNVRDIDGAIQQAIIWNNQGKNVYTCPAVLSPDLFANIEKRRQADIAAKIIKKGYRAEGDDFYCSSHVWVDVDEIEENKIPDLKAKYAICPPDYYVKTSTTPAKDGEPPKVSVHFWWSIKDVIDVFEAEKMELANKHLIANLYGDKGTHNRTRLMRLGGTIGYPKKDYRVTEMVQCRNTDNKNTYSLDDVINSYPIIEVEPLFQPAPEYKPKNNAFSAFQVKGEWSLEDIQSLLDFIPPESGVGGKTGYYDWLQVGMALHDYGAPFEMWDNWCRRGAYYPKPNEHSTSYKWSTFKKGGGVSLGSIVRRAKQGGWLYKQEEYKLKPALQATTEENLEVEVYNPVTGEVTEALDIPDGGETFEMFFADEVQPVTSCTDFVEDLLRDNEFSVIYGASNCGKTFFMLDLAMHVALGKEWRGKEVEQGGVIYAALEGGHGTKNRIVAFREHYKITDKIPLAVIPSSINFVDDKKEDLQKLINSIEKEKKRLGNIKLIVIDTLARAISGKDENSSLDMGSLISNVDEIRKITGAHVAFVHHSGKDDLKGARGHSSLRAAVDTEIEVSRPDTDSPSTIKVVKQREMEMIEDMSFTLSRYILGVNERGKEVTSCVVMPCDIIEKSSSVQLTPVQTFVYDAILSAIDTHGQDRLIYPDSPRIKCVTYDEIRDVMEQRGHRKFFETEKKTTAEQIKSATFSARAALKKKGKINMSEGYVWLV